METRIRKRGIKASREKLEMAMLNAGIKTQASLADKIAKQENLSTPPKDTINRVFREQSVSPTTITRIANILSVEPNTLYMTQGSEDKTSTKKSNTIKFKTRPLPGKFNLVVNSINYEVLPLSNAVHKLLNDSDKPVVISPSQLPDQHMSVDIARTYRSDAVLSIRSINFNRYQAIQIFLFKGGIEQLIWTDSVSNVELSQRPEDIADRFIPFLNSIISPPSELDNKTSIIPIEAQEKYLQARNLLDDHYTEISLIRAQNLLLSVLNCSPDFALAQAALAESYIFEYLRFDSKNLLEDAQQACDKALEISPHDSYVITTLSHLYRVTGKIPESINLCKKILKNKPDNIDAISGLAASYIGAYNQDITEISEAEIKALYFAEKAVEIEPDYWRHHFELGNNRQLTNTPLADLPSYEVAAIQNPDEIIY